MGRRRRRSNTSSTVLLCVWLLLVGSSSGLETGSVSITRARFIRRDDVEVVGKGNQQLVHKTESNLNYMMSKRRVPNGPDPIHNRES
ncbi:unnamed protein product [Linum tenue]|uniref:Uncharacterized protein n=1 Tax=Linum tenue TaxID=586396 RepID=A0AAV0HMU0_9ROSI|nr:unnamed protein product [Linum tenue]